MKLSYLALLILPNGRFAAGIRTFINNERGLNIIGCNAYDPQALCNDDDFTCIVDGEDKTIFTCLDKDATKMSIKSLKEVAEIRNKHCDKATEYLKSIVELHLKAIEEAGQSDKDSTYFTDIISDLDSAEYNAATRKGQVCDKAIVAECFYKLAEATEEEKTLLWKVDNDEIKYTKEEEDKVDEKMVNDGYFRMEGCATLPHDADAVSLP